MDEWGSVSLIELLLSSGDHAYLQDGFELLSSAGSGSLAVWLARWLGRLLAVGRGSGTDSHCPPQQLNVPTAKPHAHHTALPHHDLSGGRRCGV